MSADGDPPGPDTPSDLRFSEHEGRDVRVSRDLSGEGHLARGDHTRMSRLKFSARARPADPGERDLAAFGGRASPASAPPVAAPDAADPAAAEPGASPAAEGPAAGAAETDPGLLQKMGRLFGR